MKISSEVVPKNIHLDGLLCGYLDLVHLNLKFSKTTENQQCYSDFGPSYK
jgi:hypothetical protein